MRGWERCFVRHRAKLPVSDHFVVLRGQGRGVRCQVGWFFLVVLGGGWNIGMMGCWGNGELLYWSDGVLWEKATLGRLLLSE